MSQLSFSIDNKIQTSLRNLTQQMAQVQLVLNELEEAQKNYIQRNVRISAIGASTRIENAVLTDIEIDWIDTTLSDLAKTTAFLDQRDHIKDKLSKDKERSIDEVAGCRAMLQIIYQQAGELFPLSETTLRGLHKTLLEFYKPAEYYIGRYKIAANKVVRRNLATKEEIPVLIPSEPGPITESAMKDLVSWYNETLPLDPWTIAVATEFVFRFLAIHPFQDGNGRLGRGLYLLVLLQSPDKILAAVAPFLNIDRQIEKRREEYYLVLRQCSGGQFYQDSKKYDYQPFLNFMLKVISDSVGDFFFYKEKYQKLINLNFSSRQVLDSFRERAESRLTAGELTEISKLPRRTVNDALLELVREKFIQQLGKGKGTYYQLVF